MGLIVCATQGDELVFQCGYDPTFAGNLSPALSEAVVQEQGWLSRTLMNVAQVRARKQGEVAHAVVCRGPVVDNVEDFVRESCASTLVIGEPKVDSVLGAFRLDYLQSCADQMVDKTGIEVAVVAPEGAE